MAKLASPDALRLCLLTSIALGLRTIVASNGGLWRDEALFLYVTQAGTVADLFQFLQNHESHPPLFYLLMRVWLACIGGDVISALALPVLLGAAIVPLLYFIARHYFGREAASYAALLGAVASPLVEMSAYVRPYSLLPLLSLVSTYLLSRALVSPSRRAQGTAWIGWCIAALALAYTHNWGLLLVAGQWTASLVVVLYAWWRRSMRVGWGTAGLLSHACFVAGYSAWVPTLLFQVRHAGHPPQYTPLRLDEILDRLVMTLLPLPAPWATLTLIGLMVGVAFRRHRRTEEGRGPDDLVAPTPPNKAIWVLLGCPMLSFSFAVAMEGQAHLLLPRCLASLTPAGLLAVSWAIASLRLPLRGRCIVVTAVVAGMGAALAPTLHSIKSSMREMAALVQNNASPNDVILVAPEQLASSFNWYFDGPQEQYAFPTGGRLTATRFDDYIDRCAAPENLLRAQSWIDDARKRGRTLWLITDEYSFYFAAPPVVRRDGSQSDLLRSGSACQSRSNEIAVYLRQVYGPGRRWNINHGSPVRNEPVAVLEFRPPTGTVE